MHTSVATDAVIAATGLRVDGEHGPLFTGVGFSCPGGLHALQLPGGHPQAALLLVLAGRLKPTAGAVSVTSGTAALHTAYAALGVGAGDEVVTTPVTFVATASGAALLGADIVFADVSPDTGNLDPEAVDAAVTPRTRVVAGVDYAGHPIDAAGLRRDIDGRDITLLEDAAHSIGGSLDQGQVVLVVLLLTALVYGPLRLQLQRAVRRVMLGRRADPYDAIAGLASTLETTDDDAGQLAAVTRSVAAAFGVRFVGVELERPGGEQLLASYGDRPAATRTLPISYRDSPIGRLVLPARGLRSRLSRRDEELLGWCRQVIDAVIDPGNAQAAKSA